MLQCVHIRDLALIERAEIPMTDGLNVISGETGGGKSLVITALKLLRGEKAKAGLVRHGAPELRVDGEFRLCDATEAERLRVRLGELLGECPDCGADDPLILTRIVDAKGRSRVRIGGRPSTLAALREIGGWLFEIHGQGDSRALVRPEAQAETFDAFAGTTALRLEYAACLSVARGVHRQLASLRDTESERLRRLEFARFQVKEMEELGLTEGEVEALDGEHRVLAHQDRLRSLLESVLETLQDGEPSAMDQVAEAQRSLGEAAEIDHSLREGLERLKDASMMLADATRVVQSGASGSDLDPARLAVVEARIAEVRRGLQRFGPTEDGFHRALERVRGELVALEAASDLEALQSAWADAQSALTRVGRRLVRARRKAAPGFAKAVVSELVDLGMEHTALQVEVGAEAAHVAEPQSGGLVAGVDGLEGESALGRASALGPGPLDIVVQINPGEPFRSMRDTASGGEMARIVLAIKKTMADRDQVPLLVLDEIDSEIGGRLGLRVGGVLSGVAQHHQVVMVTHLPQVAAFADNHLLVRKATDGERTSSRIEPLEPAAVERELAAMAVGSGGAEDRSSLEEARRLLARARADRSRISEEPVADQKPVAKRAEKRVDEMRAEKRVDEMRAGAKPGRRRAGAAARAGATRRAS